MKKQPSKRATKPKATRHLTPPLTESCADETAAATAAGVTPLMLRLLAAAGVIGPDAVPYGYLENANSLAEVGVAFDVSERTAATWKSKGMPVNADGTYPLATIRHWRLQGFEPPEWLARGNKNLPRSEANGDFGRAILRMLRADVVRAAQRARADFLAVVGDVDRADDEMLGDVVLAAIIRHFEGFRLTDASIEELIVEAWGQGLT